MSEDSFYVIRKVQNRLDIFPSFLQVSVIMGLA